MLKNGLRVVLHPWGSESDWPNPDSTGGLGGRWNISVWTCIITKVCGVFRSSKWGYVFSPSRGIFTTYLGTNDPSTLYGQHLYNIFICLF